MPKAELKFRLEWENDIPKLAGVHPAYEWQNIPWKKFERIVYKLQKRIHQASCREDVKLVRRLQKTLTRSFAAKCIAVRKVTQDNRGKNTAGIDGIKSLKPHQRMRLVEDLKLNGKSNPVRRVWIPKPGKTEKRPLGIPTIHDRALQALAKMALEPEWEAKFEDNSYGFRPGRSAHDAIEAIFLAIRYKPKYVLDADIAKCFDKINHQKLVEKINTYPTMSRQIKAWLKSGVVDFTNRVKEFIEIGEGTPQGGVISPLLANIALHGMEEFIKNKFPKISTWKNGERYNRNPAHLIRYADDFVILHEDLEVVTKCQQYIEEWLSTIGLELKPEKTRISHTLTTINGKAGFNFLGFEIRQFNTKSSGRCKGKKLGFVSIIRPCKESIKIHCKIIGDTIKYGKNLSQEKLIDQLNPIIRGWTNYYATVSSSLTFNRVDWTTFNQLWAWAKRRHAKQGRKVAKDKYWKTKGKNRWTFMANEDNTLAQHIDVKVKRHTKVQGNRSPYDGDWLYWSVRKGKHPTTPKRIATLLQRQKGKCTGCGQYFKDRDVLEIDHIIPKFKGGNNSYNNLQLLHGHCHDTKTTEDRGDFGQVHRGAV